jgi:excisionase family DNA binding protein
MALSGDFSWFLREQGPMGLLTAREAADYLRVSLFTLGRMEKEGLLIPFRTPGGHRRYSQEMLHHYLEDSRSQRANHEKRILLVDAQDELKAALAEAFPTFRLALAHGELEVGIKLAQFKPDLVLVNDPARGSDAQELCRKLTGQSPRIEALAFQGPERQAADDKAPRIDPHLLDELGKSIAAAFHLENRVET